MVDFTSWHNGVEGEFESIVEDYSVIESMGIENIDYINKEYFADNNGVEYYKWRKLPSSMTRMLKELADEAQQTLFARRILNLVEDYKEIAETMYWEDEVYDLEQCKKSF